jgi:hypothetical protein
VSDALDLDALAREVARECCTGQHTRPLIERVEISIRSVLARAVAAEQERVVWTLYREGWLDPPRGMIVRDVIERIRARGAKPGEGA